MLNTTAKELFLGRDPTKGKWQEWQLQAYLVVQARRSGYFIEGDQNQAKRSYGAAARAKACGMQAGTPDLRWIRSGGRIKWIELKVPPNTLSDKQEEWHERAKELGHDVITISAKTPVEAWHKFLLEVY